MKIAYIIPSLLPTGPGNVVLDLVKLMTENHHQCTVYYFDTGGSMDMPCETIRIGMSEKIDFKLYDVVHSHTFRPVMYAFMHKPLRSKTRFVATIHNYVFDDLKYVFGPIKGFIYSILFLLFATRQDRLITLSKDALEYYKKWFPERKLTYIYNTRITDKSVTPTEKELRELRLFRGDGVLIGVNCSIHKRKGLDVLLKSLQRLPEIFKLYIIGDGPGMTELQELSHALKIDQRVRFCGRIQQAYKFLPYYDIYAIPSRSEGFPLSLLEAADYGCKVVCSDINIFKECFSDDEVVMFNMPSATALADAILKAEQNSSIAVNIQRRFNKDYSPTRFYERHIEEYSMKS